jgi:hypothetical protein
MDLGDSSRLGMHLAMASEAASSKPYGQRTPNRSWAYDIAKLLHRQVDLRIFAVFGFSRSRVPKFIFDIFCHTTKTRTMPWRESGDADHGKVSAFRIRQLFNACRDGTS